MPANDERKQLIKDVQQWILLSILTRNDEELEEASRLLCLLESSRYLAPRTRHIRDDHFFTTKFSALTDDQFRSTFRTTREGFAALTALLESHPVFHNNSNLKQAHPGWQIAIALNRFGHYGNKMAITDVASDFGVGIGSVTTYTYRVIEALVSHSPDWIVWPASRRRDELSWLMRQEGFPGCIGFIDGTTVPLSQKPACHGVSNFDRKKRYSINMQIVCDMDGRITAIDIGWPGSTADSSIHRGMDLFNHPESYFSAGQYLLADSAYALSNHCIPTFKSPAANLRENAAFNHCLARSRVRVEHCIGVLKGRWSSLCEMRHQLRNDKDAHSLILWITSCCVLHNMLASIGDTWEETVDDGHKLHYPDLTQTTIEALVFRDNLKKTTLETNAAKGVLTDNFK